jgi:hypothetical protein
MPRPRKTGRQCARPFKAPRSVRKDKEKIADSEIQEISGTEKARDIEGRQDEVQHVIPFVKGTMSEREADECARHGEVLRWSTDSDAEERVDITNQTMAESDTTGSTPEICKSPQLVQGRVPGSNSNITTVVEETVLEKTVKPRQYKGWVYIPETEAPSITGQESEDDSDDHLPLASILNFKKATSLTNEQLKDMKEGPTGEKAVGVTVAKLFDGVEFLGKIDSFRQVRQRCYYHVTYTDGDEEEMTQIELRDAYMLANKELIDAEWSLLKSLEKGKEATERQDDSNVETSDGEGSEYDRLDYESEVKQTKRKRKEIPKRAQKPKKNELAGVILPRSGDTTVAGEAFAKLNKAQKKL